MKHIKLFETFQSSQKFIYTGYLDGLYQIGIVDSKDAEYLTKNLPQDTGNTIEPYNGDPTTIIVGSFGTLTEPTDIFGLADRQSMEEEEDEGTLQMFDIPEGGILRLYNTGDEVEDEIMSVEDYVDEFIENYDGFVKGGNI